MRTRQTRSPTAPEPGPYLLRIVPKGWETPCRVIQNNGRYSCMIDGELIPGSWSHDELGDLFAVWLVAEGSPPIVRLVLFGKACDEATYQHRLAMKDWARTNSPDHPCLFPERPMNSLLTPAEDF